MKNDCSKWKARLAGAALAETMEDDFAQHLRACRSCSQQFDDLRARRARMESLLPLMARGAELQPGFKERVLAAAETQDQKAPAWRWRIRVLAATGALAVMAAVFEWEFRSSHAPDPSLAGAEQLAHWQAPTDALLQTPGKDLLQSAPRVGESYFKFETKAE